MGEYISYTKYFSIAVRDSPSRHRRHTAASARARDDSRHFAGGETSTRYRRLRLARYFTTGFYRPLAFRARVASFIVLYIRWRASAEITAHRRRSCREIRLAFIIPGTPVGHRCREQSWRCAA